MDNRAGTVGSYEVGSRDSHPGVRTESVPPVGSIPTGTFPTPRLPYQPPGRAYGADDDWGLSRTNATTGQKCAFPDGRSQPWPEDFLQRVKRILRHPKPALLPASPLRQRPVCSLRGRLLRLWKTGNGPGFPQAEPSMRMTYSTGSKKRQQPQEQAGGDRCCRARSCGGVGRPGTAGDQRCF